MKPSSSLGGGILRLLLMSRLAADQSTYKQFLSATNRRKAAVLVLIPLLTYAFKVNQRTNTHLSRLSHIPDEYRPEPG